LLVVLNEGQAVAVLHLALHLMHVSIQCQVWPQLVHDREAPGEIYKILS
jgi:hypothetical protein